VAGAAWHWLAGDPGAGSLVAAGRLISSPLASRLEKGVGARASDGCAGHSRLAAARFLRAPAFGGHHSGATN